MGGLSAQVLPGRESPQPVLLVPWLEGSPGCCPTTCGLCVPSTVLADSGGGTLGDNGLGRGEATRGRRGPGGARALLHCCCWWPSRVFISHLSPSCQGRPGSRAPLVWGVPGGGGASAGHLGGPALSQPCLAELCSRGALDKPSWGEGVPEAGHPLPCVTSWNKVRLWHGSSCVSEDGVGRGLGWEHMALLPWLQENLCLLPGT